MIFVIANPAFGECVFDQSYFGPDYYAHNDSIHTILWIPASNQAKIVTSSGDLVSVVHESCVVLGLEAKMFIHPFNEDNKKFKDKIMELSNIVLRDAEKISILDDIQKRDKILIGEKIDIGGPENRNLYYVVDEYSDFYVITITYSYD